MASNTRQNICDAAVRLFNERGYASVSLRQIAAEANTTIGNLTYHFGKKDDLLQAILADLHSSFSGMLDARPRGAAMLERIVELVQLNEANERAYPFYFENISQIMRQSPALHAESAAFTRDLHAYYTQAFQALWDDGWLRRDLDRATLGTLAYCMIQMEAGWVEASSPYTNELLPRIDVTQATCRLLAAYVAPEHLEEYRGICRSRGVEI